MNPAITLPKLSSKNPSHKEAIISVLGSRWPLSTKDIYSEIQRLSDANGFSYQATHKTIQQLVEEKIISKKGKNYELSQEWINRLKNFSTALSDKYSNKNNQEITPEFEGTIKWHFDDLSVFSLEMLKLITNIAKWNNSKECGVALLRHPWFPFNFKFIDFAVFIDMLKLTKGGYVVLQCDAPFDRWITKQYLGSGVTDVKLGVKELNLEHDILIFQDIIIQASFSEETRQLQDEVYSKVHDLGDLLQEFVFQRHAHKKVDIEVLITKNPALSKTMRDQLVEKYFGVKN